jgi:acyl dehydratase
MPDVFAHGMLSMAQLGRLVTNFAGQENIRHLDTRFTAITPVGTIVACSGQVTDRREVNGETLLTLKLSANIDDGTQTLKGEAIIAV